VGGVTERRFAAASRALLRDTILRATDELVAERGWPAVTMAQVASRAGVSRQTVYNEMGSRPDLARAYALWAADQLLDEVERCLAEHRDDLHEALVVALELFLDQAAEHPLIRALGATTGSEDVLAVLVRPAGGTIVVAAADRLGSIIAATWPALAPADVALLAETLVRLAISHVVLPTASPADAARAAARALAPLLDTIQARTPTTG
jgi:AcrR family transcriptional regulator